jgi:hypothetical protein
LEDKQATEDDESAFFEVEMSRATQIKKDIKWTFNGRPIDFESSDKYAFELANKTCKLIIKKIKLEDEGNYAVEINSSKSSATLTVNG